jgi:hypothetical protein
MIVDCPFDRNIPYPASLYVGVGDAQNNRVITIEIVYLTIVQCGISIPAVLSLLQPTLFGDFGRCPVV